MLLLWEQAYEKKPAASFWFRCFYISSLRYRLFRKSLGDFLTIPRQQSNSQWLPARCVAHARFQFSSSNLDCLGKAWVVFLSSMSSIKATPNGCPHAARLTHFSK